MAMTPPTSNYLRLKENLEFLRLKQLALHLDEEIAFASRNHLSLTEALLRLTDYEVEVKRQGRVNALISSAAFPHLRDIRDFDFRFQPSVNEAQIRDLLSLGFLERKENVLFLGSSGVGKTHLSVAIGLEAARSRHSTYFVKCHDLLLNLRKAQAENRLEARLKQYSGYRLLIIDELGYLPLQEGDEKLLFQLVDRRYEQKSTIVTSNLTFAEWADIFPEPRVANAILDRLLHHASVVTILGDSYRLKEHIPGEKKESEE